MNSLAVQPSNGAIVAGGTDFYFDKKTVSYESEFALARYMTNGSLDTTFGTDGEVITTFPSADGGVNLNTVLLPSTGEILAVGAANYNNSGYGPSLRSPFTRQQVTWTRSLAVLEQWSTPR